MNRHLVETHWPLLNPDSVNKPLQMHRSVFLTSLFNILWDAVRAALQNDHSVSQVLLWGGGKRESAADQSPCLCFCLLPPRVFWSYPPDCRGCRLRSERFLPPASDHLRVGGGRERCRTCINAAIKPALSAGARTDLSKGTHAPSCSKTYHWYAKSPPVRRTHIFILCLSLDTHTRTHTAMPLGY